MFLNKIQRKISRTVFTKLVFRQIRDKIVCGVRFSKKYTRLINLGSNKLGFDLAISTSPTLL